MLWTRNSGLNKQQHHVNELINLFLEHFCSNIPSSKTVKTSFSSYILKWKCRWAIWNLFHMLQSNGFLLYNLFLTWHHFSLLFGKKVRSASFCLTMPDITWSTLPVSCNFWWGKQSALPETFDLSSLDQSCCVLISRNKSLHCFFDKNCPSILPVKLFFLQASLYFLWSQRYSCYLQSCADTRYIWPISLYFPKFSCFADCTLNNRIWRRTQDQNESLFSAPIFSLSSISDQFETTIPWNVHCVSVETPGTNFWKFCKNKAQHSL